MKPYAESPDEIRRRKIINEKLDAMEEEQRKRAERESAKPEPEAPPIEPIRAFPLRRIAS